MTQKFSPRSNSKQPKWRKGWKVIGIDAKGRYTSLFITSGKVIYRQGRITRPRKGCGPLCAFSSLGDALSFLGGVKGSVLPCLYLPSRSKRVWLNPIDSSGLCFLPTGTKLASVVKLL